MNAKPFFFALLFILFSGAARAEYGECSAFVDPEISITPVFTEPHYDLTVSAVDLKDGVLSETPDRRLTATGGSVSENRVRIGGVTRFGPVIISQGGTFQSHKTPRGIVCAQIVNFMLLIKTTDITVYIANEFSHDFSCSYNVLLEHELQHVAVARRAFYGSLPYIYDRLQGFFRDLGVVQGSSVEEANETISQSIKEYMAPILTDLSSALDGTEALIDTPEEYRRVQRSCNGETQRIFNESSHH